MQLLFEMKQIMSFRILLWSPRYLSMKQFEQDGIPKSSLSPTWGPEVWKIYSCHCMHHHNLTITHHTTSMNYDASNSNSDNIDVNQTNISENSNQVIAPERSQRTREFGNVLRRGGNWENHPRGEYVLLCRKHLDTSLEIGSIFPKISQLICHRINCTRR